MEVDFKAKGKSKYVTRGCFHSGLGFQSSRIENVRSLTCFVEFLILRCTGYQLQYCYIQLHLIFMKIAEEITKCRNLSFQLLTAVVFLSALIRLVPCLHLQQNGSIHPGVGR